MSLRKVKWLGGIHPEVIMGSGTPLIMCSLRGDCAVVDGLRSLHEARPTSLYLSLPV